MTCTATLMFMAALLGQTNFAPAPAPAPMPPGAAPQGMAPEPQPIKFRLLALQVTKEEGLQEVFVDPEIQWYKDVLRQLPFDTFVQVAAGEAEALPGETARMPINTSYDAYLTPQGQTQMGLQLNIRIAKVSNGGAVDAIRADCIAAPNQVLIFQGLEYETGELMVIIGLAQEDENEDPQQNQQQEDQRDNEEEQEPEEQEQDPKEDEQREDQQDQPQDEKPKGREEIEALLDMLEAMDKQLQNDGPDKRNARAIGSAWW